MKRKQPCLGTELRLPRTFSMMIIVSPWRLHAHTYNLYFPSLLRSVTIISAMPFFLGVSENFLNKNHHHHHVMPPAQISLTHYRHFSLSFIASGRSSGLHPVFSQSYCIYIRAGRPAFARPYVGVHWSTSLML